MATIASKTGRFSYQEPLALTAARDRLAGLKLQRSSQAAVQQERGARLAEIRATLAEMEVRVLTGQATEAEAATIRAEEATVRHEWESAGDSRSLDEAIKRVGKTVTDLEQKSKDEAREKLRPIYGQAVRKLAAALEGARQASEGLEDFVDLFDSIGGEMCQWPRAWREEFRPDPYRPPGHECRLNAWLSDAKQYGLL